MPLLKLPQGISDNRPRVKVAEERKKISKRSAKATETDQELSLRIFELFGQYKTSLITTESELKEFLSKSDRFGLDTETSGLSFYLDTIAGFSLGTETESAYIPLYHEQGQNYQDSLETLYDLLVQKKLDGFNWKFDKEFLCNIDFRFKNLNAYADGYLMARILNNNMDAGLKPLYKRFIDPNVEDYSFSTLFSKPFTEYDPALVYPYAAVDAQKHTILARHLEQELQKVPDLYRLYHNLELPLTEGICETERRGIQLDKERIYELHSELETEAENVLSELQSITTPDFNPGSPKQVKEVLAANGFNLASTGEKELSAIQDRCIIAEDILKYRGYAKLLSTYTVSLLDYADSEGRAHPVFNQLGTDTGRFSSTRFNAQNIPKDNRFRNLFIPKEGNKLISVDYSQQEVRILAALAEDEAMIQAFKSGKDFYAVMASLAFDFPYESCTKKGEHSELRQHMKSVVLGLNYDMGMKSLADNLGKSVEEATEINQRFQKTCPRINEFKKKCRDFAYSHGYAETVLKRRRYFRGIGYKALGLPRFECSDKDVLATLLKIQNDRWSVNRLVHDAEAEGINILDREAIAFKEDRQCINSVIQGSAADATKLAMLTFYKDPVARKLDAQIVLQIHDEIIIECPAQNAVEAGNRLADIMNGVSMELFDLPGGGVPEIMDRWYKD